MAKYLFIGLLTISILSSSHADWGWCKTFWNCPSETRPATTEVGTVITSQTTATTNITKVTISESNYTIFNNTATTPSTGVKNASTTTTTQPTKTNTLPTGNNLKVKVNVSISATITARSNCINEGKKCPTNFSMYIVILASVLGTICVQILLYNLYSLMNFEHVIGKLKSKSESTLKDQPELECSECDGVYAVPDSTQISTKKVSSIDTRDNTPPIINPHDIYAVPDISHKKK